MTRKIFKLIVATVITVFVATIVYLAVQYRFFIGERLAFNVRYENGKTHVVNNNFNIGFDISEKCKLNSRPLDYISFKRGPWLGELVCGKNNQRINVYIFYYNEDLLGQRKKYNNYQGSDNIFVSYQPDGSNFDFLTVLNEEKKRILDLSVIHENDDVFKDVVQSLKKY